MSYESEYLRREIKLEKEVTELLEIRKTNIITKELIGLRITKLSDKYKISDTDIIHTNKHETT